MKNEKDFSKKLIEKCTSDKMHFYSLEECRNPAMPDIHVVCKGGRYPFWIELKMIESLHCAIPFRHGQQKWLRENKVNGGRNIVLVYVKDVNCVAIVKTEQTYYVGRKKLFVVMKRNGGFNGVLHIMNDNESWINMIEFAYAHSA